MNPQIPNQQRTKKKRKPCAFCQLLLFTEEAARFCASGKLRRSLYFEKLARGVREKIATVKELSLLHACNPEHNEAMRNVRRLYFGRRRADLKQEARIMLANAEKLQEQAKLRHAELLLKFGNDDAMVFRAKTKVEHYNRLVAQRRRRLNEIQ